MQFGTHEVIDWEYFGAVFAKSTDEVQATFFKSFIKECNSWGTHLQVERQLCSVNILLTKKERETLSMLSFEEE